MYSYNNSITYLPCLSKYVLQHFVHIMYLILAIDILYIIILFVQFLNLEKFKFKFHVLLSTIFYPSQIGIVLQHYMWYAIAIINFACIGLLRIGLWLGGLVCNIAMVIFNHVTVSSQYTGRYFI